MTQIDQALLPDVGSAATLPSPVPTGVPAPPQPLAKRAAGEGEPVDSADDSKVTPATVRRIAKYVTGWMSLDSTTKQVAAAAFGLPVNADVATLTVATLSNPASARWVLRFLAETKTGSLPECMDAVATLMNRPRGEMQNCWRILTTVDVVSGNMLSNEGKAAQAIVMAMVEMNDQQRKFLSDAVGAMAWQR